MAQLERSFWPAFVHQGLFLNLEMPNTYFDLRTHFRLEEKSEEKGEKKKGFRPLYDIPWLYEAREFLRKKLIDKRVDITVDYVQPASANYPEKTCCTVLIGGA
jgi:hypothetical protein